MSGKGWWNSAISGLESRLDTILAEDDQASIKARAADAPASEEAGGRASGENRRTSEQARTPSRTRPSSRLQDRLAKAVNKGGVDKVDARLDDNDILHNAPEQSAVQAPQSPLSPPVSTVIPVPSIPSIVVPETSFPRPSLDNHSSTPSQPSVDVPGPTALVHDPEEVESELAILQKIHEQALHDSREERDGHLERIDALQSKLAYLSQQLVSSSKAAAADPEATSEDRNSADKDAQIATLMEEGQKLSKTEMKHLATIKKMRAKAQEQEKEISTLKQRLAKAERGITEQSDRAKHAEAAERAAQDRIKVVGRIEKDIESIRAEREEASLTITKLREQLDEAALRIVEAEKRAQVESLEVEKRATASLREDIENLRIEKKLAEDRAKREAQAALDEAKGQHEKAKVVELELRGEIANLESKLELLRSRTEEVTSSATGDSQAKLLRQIETLQTQYSLASENWQGIETTLISRVAALEKDRDETAKRESEVRRKAREVNSKARKLEDELETINERARAFEHSLAEQSSAAQKLQSRLSQAERAAQDARSELERERKVWEAESQQRLEEEKSKWRQEVQTPSLLGEPGVFRTDSHSTSQRRHSPDALGIYNRKAMSRSSEMPPTPMDRMFDESSRRPTNSRQRSGPKVRTPDIGTPQRQNSIPSGMSYINGSGSGMYTPSIRTVDHDDPFETTSSPHRTINDMISVSTVGAGPSVQLVERMSAAVRRLESEKATSKEELHYLAAQRDEAREEVVALMREVEAKRAQEERVAELEKRLADMDGRYQTTLEMLGEKTEMVEELEGDVNDLKKIYRELVQTMK